MLNSVTWKCQKRLNKQVDKALPAKLHLPHWGSQVSFNDLQTFRNCVATPLFQSRGHKVLPLTSSPPCALTESWFYPQQQISYASELQNGATPKCIQQQGVLHMLQLPRKQLPNLRGDGRPTSPLHALTGVLIWSLLLARIHIKDVHSRLF